MSKPLNLTGVPNLKDMLREAERLGCTVSRAQSNGEVRVISPDGQVRLNLNARRKDGNRALRALLRNLQ